MLENINENVIYYLQKKKEKGLRNVKITQKLLEKEVERC